MSKRALRCILPPRAHVEESESARAGGEGRERRCRPGKRRLRDCEGTKASSRRRGRKASSVRACALRRAELGAIKHGRMGEEREERGRCWMRSGAKTIAATFFPLFSRNFSAATFHRNFSTFFNFSRQTSRPFEALSPFSILTCRPCLVLPGMESPRHCWTLGSLGRTERRGAPG